MGSLYQKLSTYLGRVTGHHYRTARKKAGTADSGIVLEGIASLAKKEEVKEEGFMTELSAGKISLRQYNKLVKESAKRFLKKLGGLEHALAHYTTVIALLGLAIGFGVYAFVNPSITGNAVLEGKFDANFLMFSLVVGASALLLLAKLSMRVLKR